MPGAGTDPNKSQSAQGPRPSRAEDRAAQKSGGSATLGKCSQKNTTAKNYFEHINMKSTLFTQM